MKKLLCIAVLFMIALSIPAWGASITVTSPEASSSWCTGGFKTYIIRWSKSGSMQATAAIRLRAAGSSESDPAALAIADGTANDGTFSWTIPASVAAGSYFIRVRTDDSTVMDDSPVFRVINCPASITVNAPAAGANWQRGTTKTITWAKSGAMQATAAIRLRRAGSPESEAATLAIADGTTNDGSFSWDIPETVAEGQYFIRVRTDDSTVSGDSAVFNVTKFLVADLVIIPGYASLARNLELVSVRYIFSRGGYIVARVKNHINAIDMDVSFRLTFPEGGGPGAQTITRRVALAAGAEGDIYLQPLAVSGIPPTGLLTRVMVDGPTSQITETDERDNTREARLTIVDIRISAPRDDLELSRLYMQGGWDYRMKFKIHVSHNQEHAVNNIRVKWEMYDSGGLMRFTGGSWTIESLASGDEWVRTAEQKFGQQGRSNAHHPKLSKGGTYRIVASIVTPDDFDGNNTSAFSFTVPD